MSITVLFNDTVNIFSLFLLLTSVHPEYFIWGGGGGADHEGVGVIFVFF
jgi:hypothetical protein